MSQTQLEQLVPIRPQPGEIVDSRAFPANVPAELILPVLGEERTSQFMRCVPVVASVAVEASVSPDDFGPHDEIEAYKVNTGWLTPRQLNGETSRYWQDASRLAAYVGASFSPLFTHPDFHDSRQPAAVSVVMEHKRTHSDGASYPLDNPFKPTFSGTTCFEKNVAPDKFGAHLDLVHSSPILIGFIARGGGTIVREGLYPALDPLSSQSELNATGDILEARQLPDDELHYGDARTLMHEAPGSQDGWRDHIRFYVAPQFAKET